MKGVKQLAVIFWCLITLTGCVTYIGDDLLDLPKKSTGIFVSDNAIIAKAKKSIFNLSRDIGILDEMKEYLKKTNPKGVIYHNGDIESIYINNQLVMAEGDIETGFAKNSIIISKGNIDIAHSHNNIIISGGNINISGDGVTGGTEDITRSIIGLPSLC